MKKNDHSLAKRVLIDIAGFGLIVISPFIGWLPGPGGIAVFLAGLGLLSINHQWAKNLIDQFENNRQKFEAKYLNNNPKVARTIDILCMVLITLSIIAVYSLDNKLLRYISIGPGSLGLILLILNQNRFDKFLRFLKSKLKHE